MRLPRRIAEIRRAGSERVGSERNPSRVGQIRSGLHHDGHAAGPRHAESKTVRPCAEACIVCLYLWSPEDSWKASKRQTPTCRPRQVKSGCISVAREHISARIWSVAFEVDGGQSRAAIKR